MVVTLISYGAKHNHSEVDDMVVDRVFSCHSIRNPYSVGPLRGLTGLDKAVRDYVMEDIRALRMLTEACEEIRQGHGTLLFECYGGRHRSVTMAEVVAENLRYLGHDVTVQHLSLPGGTNG